MKNIIILSFILIISFLSNSCESILEPAPVGRDVVENIYVDADGAIAAINAAYAALGASDGNSAASVYYEPIWTMMDMSTDDAQGIYETNSLTYGAGFETLNYYWEGCFTGIYRANVVIDRIDGMSFDEDQQTLKGYIEGQAYFLRALNYFNLVIAFGDVPLIKSEVTSLEEVAVARAPKEEVYELIEEDLLRAIELLPLEYNEEGKGFERGRATIGAAQALLAKHYLWLGNFDSAIPLLKEIVESGVYELHPNYADNFQGKNENGIESIFEIQHSKQGIPSYSDNYWIPREVHDAGQQRCWPTDENPPPQQNAPVPIYGLIQAFAGNDERSQMLTNLGLEYRDGIPLRKMNTKFLVYDVAGRNSAANTPVIRYADVLLLLAESINEVEGPDNAYQYINKVRNRAGLDNVSGLNKEQFRDSVRHERRVELYLECGHRWYDLRRWGIFLERVRAQREVGVQEIPDQYRYFPIPQLAMNRNSKLIQNEGEW